MRAIVTLKNKFVGHECIIFGGGRSVLDLDLSSIPGSAIRFAINDNIPKGTRIDYLIYNDLNMARYFKLHRLAESYQTIAFANSAIPSVAYTYQLSDIAPLLDTHNTGAKALKICKDILGFERVYLAGFDYYDVDGVSHFNGDEVGPGCKYSDEQRLNDHLKRLRPMVDEFNSIPYSEGVYNCNLKSRLALYQYGLPY